MPNPHPVTAGNVNWRLAMRRAGFKKGWVNRVRCRAIMRNGQECTRLAMVSAGVMVCGCHGGYAAAVRKGLRNPTRKYRMYRPISKTSKTPV